MSDAEQFEQFINSPVLDQIVQRNAEKYKAKWRAMFAKAQSLHKMAGTQSWNWAAFFFSAIWMLYRRMYLWGAVYLAAYAAVSVAAAVTGKDNLSSIQFVLNIVCGLLGNAWYFRHVYGKVNATAQASVAPTQVGTSWVAAITGSVAIVAVNAVIPLIASGALSGPRLASVASQSSEMPNQTVPSQTPSKATIPTSTQSPASQSAISPPDLAGEYSLGNSECCDGGLVIKQVAGNKVAVQINTVTRADQHVCNVETDDATDLSGGTVVWTDGKCAIALSIKSGRATVSAKGEECSQLCGAGAEFEGTYTKK